MRHRVVIWLDENGMFVAECLTLPGCVSQGKTKNEALENVMDAIAGYLESLRKHNELLSPEEDSMKLPKTRAKRSPEIHCLDCGAELKPDNSCCPSCGSQNKVINAYEKPRMHEMLDLKVKASGYKKFKKRLRHGEKIAGESQQPAQEFDAYDKECNIRCHIVVEQDLNGEYKLVHCHVEPLDPTKPVKGPTNQPKVPYEVDHETDGHIILRHVDPPHRRLVVPKQKELSLSLLKALWRQAQLNVQEFGELLIWCWNKHG